MRRFTLWVFVVSLAVPLAAVTAGQAPDGGRSTAVYPEQQLPLTFSHRRHLEQGLQCVTCHGSAPGSTQVQDNLIPDHAVCTLCHLVQAPNAAELYPKAACSTCHGDYEGGVEHVDATGKPLPDAPPPPAVVIPPARLTFSHERHVSQGVPCLQCHAGVQEAELATREHLPDMGTCLDCHDGGKAPSECTTCHLQGDGGRVLTELGRSERLTPAGRFRSDDHDDPRWLEVHQAAARSDGASCSACHEPADCLDCHEGVEKPLQLHPADWKMTHGLEASRRSLDCFACHEVQQDCASCHSEASLLPGQFPGSDPSVAADPALRFHPEGWAGLPGESPGSNHHSFSARRSLETCESCHGGDGEQLCLDCHGSQVSPHPDAWGEDPGRWNFGQGDGRVCLRCHLPGDPVLDAVGR